LGVTAIDHRRGSAGATICANVVPCVGACVDLASGACAAHAAVGLTSGAAVSLAAGAAASSSAAASGDGQGTSRENRSEKTKL
jgi:hypothetical protein